MDGVLLQLASTKCDPTSLASPILELLLADALAAAVSARGRLLSEHFASDGTIGHVSLLAMRCSIGDLDDVDWTSLHHPGSVVWPVVLAVGGAAGIDGPSLRRAACSGYQAAATLADLLGPLHRASWHVTATAGAVGAASAASTALGLSVAQHEHALALAAANVGGLSAAATERRGAAVFNRAAAASLGVAAARASLAGVSPVLDPIGGAGGLLEVMSGSQSAMVRIRSGVPDAVIRRYPTNGFLQSAVAATCRIRAEASGDLVEMRVHMSDAVLRLVDGSAHGAWWDGRLCLLRAWAGGSPFSAATPSPLDADTALVRLLPSDLPVGGCQVTVVTSRGTYDSGPVDAPRWADRAIDAELDHKWSILMGTDPARVRDLAASFLRDGVDRAELKGVLS